MTLMLPISTLLSMKVLLIVTLQLTTGFIDFMDCLTPRVSIITRPASLGNIVIRNISTPLLLRPGLPFPNH